MAKQPKSRSWPHKVRPVPVAQMRVPPAGVSQRRFSRAQAEQYAADFDLNKFGIPAVNWRDGIYWIVDGQHRVEALKLFFAPSDPGLVDCNVYEQLTDAEMAMLFDGLNTRRNVNPFDTFLVRCTAGYKRETGIRRVVESQGLKISQSADEGCIGAVSSLGRVFDRFGDVVLGQALRAAKNAYAGDPAALDGKVIEGLGLVFNRYNGRTNEKDMATRLAATPYGIRGLMRRAETMRERTGNNKAQCIAAVIIDIYNKGIGPRAKDRLPSWWKESE